MDPQPATTSAHTAGTVPAMVPAVGPGASGVAGMIGSLAVVLALIFAMAWLARRLQRLRGQTGGLQVIAATPVGAKEKVVVLRAGDEHFLLGVGGGGVTLLHRYEQLPPALIAPETAPADLGAFAARLREKLGKTS